LLKGFKAVPRLVTDINLSLDDRFLYVSCWGTGEFIQYHVSDPANPKKTGSVHLDGIVRRAAHPAKPDRPSMAGRRWWRDAAFGVVFSKNARLSHGRFRLLHWLKIIAPDESSNWDAGVRPLTCVATFSSQLLGAFCPKGTTLFWHRNVAPCAKKWNHRAKRWFHFQVPL
jgi:56kDa selenium binding protein (SBP56)